MVHVAVTQEFARRAREYGQEHSGYLVAVPNLDLGEKVGSLGIVGIRMPQVVPDHIDSAHRDVLRATSVWTHQGLQMLLYTYTQGGVDQVPAAYLLAIRELTEGRTSGEVILTPSGISYREAVVHGTTQTVGMSKAEEINPSTLNLLPKRRLDRIVADLSAPSAFPAAIQGQVFPKVPILGR